MITILGIDKNQYKSKLNKAIWLWTLITILVLAINCLLVVLRNDANHIAFLLINLISDTVLVILLIWNITNNIMIRKKILSKFERSEISGKIVRGTILSISEKTNRIQGFDCNLVVFKTLECEKEFYLIKNSLPLKEKEKYVIKTMEGVIMAAGVDI